MAQRFVYDETPPVNCNLGVVGDNQLYNVCDTRLGAAVRVIFKRRDGTNPFATFADLQSQAVWTAALALTTADAPNNLFATTKIYEFEQIAGEPNVLESASSGDKRLTYYSDDVINIDFAFLSKKYGNDVMASIRDNANNLECLFVHLLASSPVIRSGISGEANPLTAIPTWIPIRLATVTSRNIPRARGEAEIHSVALHFEPEVLQNAEILTTPDFNILNV